MYVGFPSPPAGGPSQAAPIFWLQPQPHLRHHPRHRLYMAGHL